MATLDELVDDILIGDITVGGGIDQADLFIRILEIAQDMAVSQHEVGLGLISFIRDQMADPFNILSATSLFGQAGGGTLAPAAGFAATGGQPSAFGPLFDELLQSVSQFALGEFELPELPELPPDEDLPGGVDPDNFDSPQDPQFSNEQFLSHIQNIFNANPTDANWFLNYAAHWEQRIASGTALDSTATQSIATAKAYAQIINEMSAGTLDRSDRASVEARLRQLISGDTSTPTSPAPEPTAGPDVNAVSQIAQWYNQHSTQDQAAIMAKLIRQSFPELEPLAQMFLDWSAGLIGQDQVNSAFTNYATNGTLPTPTAKPKVKTSPTALGQTATPQQSPLAAVQQANVPLVPPAEPKQTVL